MVDFITYLVQRLIDEATSEVSYLCCFKTHVENFEKKREKLEEKRDKVLEDLEDAKKRNETQVRVEVQHWLKEVDFVFREDHIRKKKWSYGWRPDCFPQYRQGKKSAKMMSHIRDLIERCNFDKVARPAKHPGLEYYYSSQDIISFESRMSTFNELVNALANGNHCMIGLHGLGGTGKTTLAIQVGKQVDESKVFDHVIFAAVFNPPDINKIRRNIAWHLDLLLEEGKEEEHSKVLWSRLANEGRVLIILDDIWEELDLRDIGIPFGPNCSVLITTRDLKVCETMGCRLIIRLQPLAGNDALNLFIYHAGLTSDDLDHELLGFAQEIVADRCGGLPLAIVAIAKTLKDWPQRDWRNALKTFQLEPLHNVHEDLTKIYRCLKSSYDNLLEQAKHLLLLCSLFPKDYKIPINLLCKLGIGLGLFGEVHNYFVARTKAISIVNDLTKSSLLFEAEKVHVMMHDLVREMALWMPNTHVQVITDSSKAINSNLRFLFWCSNDFPHHFDGKVLEFLVLWVTREVGAKYSYAIFKETVRLRVLFLRCYNKEHLTLSLQPLKSLKNIRTLILDGWELCDISILKRLQNLETLEMSYCLIIELPKEIWKIKKLRSLGLRYCEIEMNNPFEVIERCPKLEELFFVGNYRVEDWDPKDDKESIDEVTHEISLPGLQMYSIASDDPKYFVDDNNGLLKYFNTKHMKNLISEAMFKYLVARAQVLELGEIGEIGWKTLVPDVIPMEFGDMNDLIKLCLYDLADIECLIDNSEHVNNDILSGILKQLQILKLWNCKKLQNICFDDNLKFPHLKVLELENCPMLQPSIFQSSVARNLVQLEELIVKDCEELKSLITYESLGEEIVDVDNQKSHGLLFPKLKSLQILRCGRLELVSSFLLAGDLPLLEDIDISECEELEYMFGEYRDESQVLNPEFMLPSLIKMKLDRVPRFINIYRECSKCLQSQALILKDDSKKKHANSKRSAPVVFNPTSQQHTTSRELCASVKGIEIFHIVEGLLRQPLNLQNLREMVLVGFSKLKSLFRIPIATTIMLEKLTIGECEELKHIITKGEDDDHVSWGSIFAKLEILRIRDCNKLDFFFPSTFSGGLQKLKHIDIDGAHELKYVFGKYDHEDYVSNDKENNELNNDLPALKTLSLRDVPNMISIYDKKYHLKSPSLQHSEASKAIKKHMPSVTREGVEKSEIEEIVNAETPMILSAGVEYALNFRDLQEMTIRGCNMFKTMFSTSTCRSLSQLSRLDISYCEELVNVVDEDSKDIGHIHSSSFFPKLKYLYIGICNKLKFMFPSSLSGGLSKLESLFITEAAELKYVFGKDHQADYLSQENERQELYIFLPTLKILKLEGLPNMIGICAEKYYLWLPSLQIIALDNCQMLKAGSLPELMIYLQGRQLNLKTAKDSMKIGMQLQKLTTIKVGNSKTEELFNLEGVKIKGPVTLNLESMALNDLTELRHICKGPKYILSLLNLSKLEIRACKKLRVIFSISILKSLPQLSSLKITDCEELVQIIEEDYEESADDHLHQLRFPKLKQIYITRCNRLKCLFSITTSIMFPKLRRLEIEEASELEQVFTCKQDDTEKMEVEDVFPNLAYLALRKLPRLNTICGGIDFQTVGSYEVVDCPKYQEITSQLQEEDGNLVSENQAAIEELLSAHSNDAATMPHMGGTSGSSNFAEINQSVTEKMNQGLQENYVIEDAIIEVQSASSDSKKQSTGPFVNLSGKDSAQGTKETGKEIVKTVPAIETSPMATPFDKTTKETRDASIEERPTSDKATKASLFDVVASLHHESQTGTVGPSSSRLGIGEILELTELRDGEPALLVKALEQYPQLRLCREQRTRPIIASSYRVLIDILVMLATKTLYTITASDKLTLEENLIAATFLGFDKNWVESVRAKVFGFDMSNVLEMQEENFITEAELEAREQVQKESTDVKEQLAIVHTQLEMAQSEIEANFAKSEKETLREIEAEDLTSALEEQVVEILPAESQFRTPSIHELEDEQTMSEPTVQLQHQGLGETETIIRAPHKNNMPFDDDCLEAILKERVQESPPLKDIMDLMKIKSTSDTIMTHQLKLEEMTTVSVSESIPKDTEGMKAKMVASPIYSEAGGSQYSPSTLLVDEQPRTEPNLKNQLTLGEGKSEIKIPHQTNVVNMEETVEQGFQKHDGSKEATIAIQSKSCGLRKQSGVLLDISLGKELAKNPETGKEVAGMLLTSELSMATTSNLETKEETSEASVQEGTKSDNVTKANLSDAIPSPRQSHIDAAGPSPTLEIDEILELVELKDSEASLLAEALKLYPQLRLSREQHEIQICLSISVLIDILVMLAIKTPYTILVSDKLTLERNLRDATICGFDKDWIESVRAKVSSDDMSDVLAVEIEIRVMEAVLETCDIDLDQVLKQRVEAKERLQSYWNIEESEIEESEFEAIESQLLDLLEDRKKLSIKITELKEIISAKDKPFGI